MNQNGVDTDENDDMKQNNTNDGATGREGVVKINLFTADLKPVGEYYAPTVPREGEQLVWEEDDENLDWQDELYKVTTVTWEGLPDTPEVQVRLE